MVHLQFPEDFDERSEAEAVSRGYLSRAQVATADGRAFAVFFIDPVRLAQDVETLAAHGSFFAEVGLIVVPEVTRPTMEAAVEDLARRGFFDYFRPLTDDDRPWEL